MFIRRVKKGNLADFPSLEETVTEDASLHPDLVSKIVEHLHILCTSFDDYFSCGELQPCDDWIRHPFKQNMEDVDDDSNIKEDLIELRNNRGIQMEFADGHLEHFWASQLETYCYVHPPCFFFFTPSLSPQQHVSGHRVHTGLPGAQAGQQSIGGVA